MSAAAFFYKEPVSVIRARTNRGEAAEVGGTSRVAGVASQAESRPPSLVRQVQVGAGLDEQLEHRQRASLRSRVERRLAFIVHRVNRRRRRRRRREEERLRDHLRRS
jgi:hypothetical protein